MDPDKPQKPRKGDRFFSKLPFGRSRATTPGSSRGATPTPVPSTSQDESSDRQRTRHRHDEAVKELKNAIKDRTAKWGSFTLPEIGGQDEYCDVSQFKENINTILADRIESLENKTSWEKCEHVLERWFIAFTPFAKNALDIATQGSNVS
jgi:hypothetical protein